MEDIGLSHFLAQADLLGQFVLLSLLAMSLTSWSLILLKIRQLSQTNRAGRAFLDIYHHAHTPQALVKRLIEGPPTGSYERLAATGFEIWHRLRRGGEYRVLELRDPAAFIADHLAFAVSQERDRLDKGLTVLATVGSTAPFIGLLGTVWGIYHALIAIGMTGQGTLDKVAGPVGEALVMTAFGLAVAIPAVLAYNSFISKTRAMAGALEAFARELLTFFATGIQATTDRPSHLAEELPLAAAEHR